EPLKFRDKLKVHLKLVRIRAAALEFETDFYRINKDGTETKVAVGTHKTIHCMYDATQRQNPKICPADGAFLESLEVYQEV
ncbi:MAG: hypothetical protein NE330_23000, partial [Lentisphaeraceae bacterium]|nr:hypothetical protein [Lentisphaeraceae bacterium]